MTARVLVIGPAPALLDELARALSPPGFEVSRAASLDDAAGLLAAGRFDATLFAVELGEDAAALSSAARGALVAVGSLADADAVQRWFDLGATGFIMRPFSPASLSERVSSLIERAERGAPALAHIPGPRGADGPSLRALAHDASLRTLLDAAAAMLDVPIVLVTELSGDKQLLRLRVGLEVESTRRDDALCAYTIARGGTFVVEDASLDPRFRDNPLVAGEPFVRFYAGVPVTVDGAPSGALCVLDRRARRLEPRAESFLRALGLHVGELARAAASAVQTEQVLEAAPDWIQSVDGDGVIRFANAAWRDALGYAAPIGMHIDRVLAPGDVDERARVRARVLDAREHGAAVTAMFRVVTADGSMVAVRGRTRWLSADRTVTVLERADGRRHAADPATLELGAVADALRAPLATMRGTLGLLAGALDGELRDLARQGADAGRDAAEVLDDLAELDRARQGALSLGRAPTSLGQLLDLAFGAKHHERDCPDLDVDAIKVARGLRALARDAASPRGEVIASSERGRCVLTLRGPGLPAASAERIGRARARAGQTLHGGETARTAEDGSVAWTVTLPRSRPSLDESSPRRRMLSEALDELRRGVLDVADAQVALARTPGNIVEARPTMLRLAATASTAGLDPLAAAAARVADLLGVEGGALGQALDELERTIAAAR